MEATTKRITINGGELRNLPGHWKIKVEVEGEDGERTVIRKPDGTFWSVVGIHLFPPSGGTVTYELGDQIVDQRLLAQCESNCKEILESLAEKKNDV